MAGAGKRLLGLAGMTLEKRAAGDGLPGLAFASFQQIRGLGGGYEVWGQPSKYTEGTKFLGTPDEHLTLTAKRPLSPDVFELGDWKPHYKFPIGALSSITNRGAGMVLSAGCIGAGLVALTGDVPATVDVIKSSWLLCFPAKVGVAFPLLFHYLGGLRHLYWDAAQHGNQADKKGPLELQAVEQSSMALFGVSGAAAVILAAFY
ncbi:unnamed protein product [Ostreobium quekettii]|uniref:Succinate dehydrogenase cytochrome b560 subunit, mitochondrial n=1 Tax=Ostreobium quekettii TaxID=121088 RepID=A0A8S1IZZ3_9CHLO|nr:unnamed protein product [Ostreobium quekettii]|eukprot:evm.model.scf_930.1 EVM.evm.TU.scf_930.1   scf_930:1497-4429(-)